MVDAAERSVPQGSFSMSRRALMRQCFADVLLCLSRDPLAGVISPPLIGTEGVIVRRFLPWYC